MNRFYKKHTLDKHTLQSLETWLLRRESALLTAIDLVREADAVTVSTAGSAATDVIDLEGQASKWESAALQDAETQRDHDELSDVRAALIRLNIESYGTCIDCAEPIDPQRLAAIPAAARCIACQTKFEADAM